MRSGLLLTALLWSAVVFADDVAAPSPLPLDAFTRSDEFGEVKISPDGQLLAMTLGKYGSTALAFFEQMHDFARGILDARSLVLYLSLTFFCLYLTLRIVESRRWK